MATISNLLVTRAVPFTEWSELNIQGLYLYHTPIGPNANQVDIIDSKAPIGIGATAVNNWEVYDGPKQNADKLVARAQGLHVHAGNWANSFSLVFVDERFSGSTLEVMGIVVETGEWAIVGGTGQFAMATGVIYKKVHKLTTEGNIIELRIRAIYPKLNIRYPVKKLGTWGGRGGSPQDITDLEASKRLESITVRSGSVVDSIEFSYIDFDGQKHSVGPWGGPGGEPHTIQLAESEFVTEVSGTLAGPSHELTVVTSIKFVTNHNKTYGPWGAGAGKDVLPITNAVPPGSRVVGFFGRSGTYLDAIGVYVRPL